MEILIRKLSSQEIDDFRIKSWPIWTKEISEFDWHYDLVEDCLLLEGSVLISYGKGKSVTIKAGDYVTFPAGLSCHWIVTEAVRKHYRFR